jgi:hypothetical protein
MFKKRIGEDPHANGRMTSGGNGCPDIWELLDGNFAIIGARKTSELKSLLPESASCGDDEEIVVIPRNLLIGAKNDIPND